MTPTHWTGNFSVDGVGGADWEGTFVSHVDGDGAGDAECSSASRSPLAAAAINEVTTTSVAEGQVEVQPLVFGDVEAPPVARGAAVMLSAGQEVRVSATAVGAVGAVGQSASPGVSAALTKA